MDVSLPMGWKVGWKLGAGQEKRGELGTFPRYEGDNISKSELKPKRASWPLTSLGGNLFLERGFLIFRVQRNQPGILFSLLIQEVWGRT